MDDTAWYKDLKYLLLEPEKRIPLIRLHARTDLLLVLIISFLLLGAGYEMYNFSSVTSAWNLVQGIFTLGAIKLLLLVFFPFFFYSLCAKLLGVNLDSIWLLYALSLIFLPYALGTFLEAFLTFLLPTNVILQLIPFVFFSFFALYSIFLLFLLIQLTFKRVFFATILITFFPYLLNLIISHLIL